MDTRAQRTVDFLVSLNQRLQRDIRYLIRLEPGVQTPEETLRSAAGSCRDTGWLLVQVLRHLGLAARFVSGYLIQLKPDVQALDGPSGAEQDFTDLHAWCEVYLPGAGWIGLDPTSGMLAGEGHLPVACTPEPTTAAPISGVVDDCEVEFGHTMQVTRIYEAPRVTKPYTEDQWRALDGLGRQVDADLAAMDVRLTQGGEPTFVSIDDRDGAEWNTAALGPTKRVHAIDLLLRLQERYSRGGFLHFGQGKWYPGEQLPRWALSILWRADGESVLERSAAAGRRARRRRAHDRRTPNASSGGWRSGSASTPDARCRGTRTPGTTCGASARCRRTSTRSSPGSTTNSSGRACAVSSSKGSRPGPVSPCRSRANAPMAPRRAGSAGRGSCGTGGCTWSRATRRWATGCRSTRCRGWTSGSGRCSSNTIRSRRAARCRCMPTSVRSTPRTRWAAASPRAARSGCRRGSSRRAMIAGQRRPLRARRATRPPRPAPDRPRPARPRRRRGPAAQGRPPTARARRSVSKSRDPRRASGTAGERAGSASSLLYVFMPPLAALEDYLELVAAVEATAAELGLPVVLEGYPPPRDPRLRMLQITPDPGVIEVNIHPAANWDELVDHTETLYEAARLSRLSTEKFMLDGRHTGTGGGNHIVLGAARAEDSPFLRRPDLLASLVSYWHNHPSLSYLFSGLFIGPTSQAPRVDEARNDQVYELEIALAELRRRSEARNGRAALARRPVAAQRAGRRDGQHASLGVLHRQAVFAGRAERSAGPARDARVRDAAALADEPGAATAAARAGRALLATPYTARLTRWGTELHDRFLLPTLVALDFDDVLAELAEAGYPMQSAWFAPHLEFRFPLYGHVDALGIRLTIRGALEPWHVMGEEGAAGGTVRYVDSSLERVEVKASGLNGSRHVVTVNGRTVPLQPTGRAGEFVCGVRYRAWQPVSALHPTIGVHAPLTFDIVDNWMERSLGGCRYHVAHPGGRNYVTFPVNAYEAESRRLARFFTMGHTPGRLRAAEPQRSAEFPFTLDLRRT